MAVLLVKSISLFDNWIDSWKVLYHGWILRRGEGTANIVRHFERNSFTFTPEVCFVRMDEVHFEPYIEATNSQTRTCNFWHINTWIAPKGCHTAHFNL